MTRRERKNRERTAIKTEATEAEEQEKQDLSYMEELPTLLKIKAELQQLLRQQLQIPIVTGVDRVRDRWVLVVRATAIETGPQEYQGYPIIYIRTRDVVTG